MKNSQQRFVLYLGILIAGLFWIGYSADPNELNQMIEQTAPQAGFKAPDFELTTIEGKTIKLSALRGQPVLLNIWASWCAPCRAEMPAIEQAYQRYKDQGLMVLAVNSTVQDKLKDINTFLEEIHLTFPILLDEDGKVTSAYQITGLPTTFFIDRNGIVQEVVIGGPMSETSLIARIEKLLQEKP